MLTATAKAIALCILGKEASGFGIVIVRGKIPYNSNGLTAGNKLLTIITTIYESTAEKAAWMACSLLTLPSITHRIAKPPSMNQIRKLARKVVRNEYSLANTA